MVAALMKMQRPLMYRVAHQLQNHSVQLPYDFIKSASLIIKAISYALTSLTVPRSDLEHVDQLENTITNL